MPIILYSFLDRQTILNQPQDWFMFSDSMNQRGLFETATAARGLANVIGVTTRWQASKSCYARFRDPVPAEVMETIQNAFGFADSKLRSGYTVHIPAKGFATDIPLKSEAPIVAEYIRRLTSILLSNHEMKETKRKRR